MKSTRMGLGLGFALGAVSLAGVPACEPQVGEEYEGEVQFSLEGTVNGADEGMRPRLAFYSQNDEVLFVDGTVTGSFPSKFRFDVTEPPPPEALLSSEDESFEGQLAIAYIVMMSEGTPDRIPYLTQNDSEGGCTDDGASCTWYETACNEDGLCRERTLACEPCEVIGSKGDPALRDQFAPYSSTGYVAGGASYALTTYCADEENCYHEYTMCEPGEEVGFDTPGMSGVETCSVVEESGDPSVLDLSELQIFANQYVVLYVPERIVGSFGTLEKGYNLYEMHTPTPEEILAAPITCVPDEFTVFQCGIDMPLGKVVSGSDVSIELGFPPM